MDGRAYTIMMALLLIMRAAWAAEAMSECSDDDAECMAALTDESARLKVHLIQKKVEQHRQPLLKATEPEDASGQIALGQERHEIEKDASLQGDGVIGEDSRPNIDAAGLAAFRTYLADSFTFDNQSAMDKFVKEHASAWLSYKNETKGSVSLVSTETTYALAYSGQWFKPRLSLCQDSFTGLASCTLAGCNALATIWYGPHSFHGAQYCHSVFYSNAASNSNGEGMCRCWPMNKNNIIRYSSSSGNNIYSSESWFP
jgi:hypothetical protein